MTYLILADILSLIEWLEQVLSLVFTHSDSLILDCCNHQAFSKRLIKVVKTYLSSNSYDSFALEFDCIWKNV